MSKPEDIQIGKTYEVPAPFILDVFSSVDEEGWSAELSWRPGVVWEPCGPDDSEAVAHGVGKVFYRVVDVHKLPRPFPTRVFFTRKWLSPANRLFGAGKLHIMTLEAFRRRLRSYRPAGGDIEVSVRPLDEEQKAALLATKK